MSACQLHWIAAPEPIAAQTTASQYPTGKISACVGQSADLSPHAPAGKFAYCLEGKAVGGCHPLSINGLPFPKEDCASQCLYNHDAAMPPCPNGVGVACYDHGKPYLPCLAAASASCVYDLAL
jgi:hypothetical protein